mgnify:CR=1 FL=1
MTKFNKERFDAIYNAYCVYNPTWVYNNFGSSKETRHFVALCKKRKQREELKKEALAPEKREIVELLEAVVRTLPASGYSMGEVKTLKLTRGGYAVSADCRDYYARSCRWKPAHGDITVVISPRDLTGVRVRGGLPTRITGSYSKDIRKCEWIEWQTETYRGKVTSVYPKWEKGYLVRDWHTESLEEAKKTLANCKRLEKERAANCKRLEKERAAMRKEYEKAFKALLKTDLCFEDSVNAGNCRPGTIAFCKSNNLRLDSIITGKKLLSLADKATLYYIARIFAYKMKGRSPYREEVEYMKEYIKTKKEV